MSHIPSPYDTEARAPLTAYLSGPIGDPKTSHEWAILLGRTKLAADVQGRLLNRGIVCINPYASACSPDNWQYSREDWVNGDCFLIRACDLIVMLPGWNESWGAQQELKYARSVGCRVAIWNATLNDLNYME